MKYKFIKAVTALLAVIAVDISCNKKDLNLTAPQISEPAFFKTEAEFRMAIVGTYAMLTDYFSSATSSGANNTTQSRIWMLPGDDLTNDQNPDFEYFGQLTPGTGEISDFFRSSYILIGRANKVIARIKSAESGVFTTPGLKNKNEGEMLFLRAYGHYMLWNVFGKYAPLDTVEVTSLSQLNPPSSTQTQLLDQAISDLTRAANLLTSGTEWSEADLGRVTANSANGLLGKCLVFRGTVNNTPADFTAAIAAFNKISGVSLVSNFRDNFDYKTENNSESLFEFQAGAPLRGPGSTNIWLGNDLADIGVSSAYWTSFGWFDTPGNNNAWTSYIGGGFWTPTAKLVNIFDENDPRRNLTFNKRDWGYSSIEKYISSNKEDATGASVNNPRILRYADVLLLKAEAILNSGGSTAEAIELLNTVRKRARDMVENGTSPAALDITNTNRTTIMQWIMDERLMELAAEGQRWFDLRRWAIGGKITLNNAFFSAENADNMRYESSPANKYLTFPIPFSETDKNKNITPTPGY